MSDSLTIPTALITDEMRAAGVTEETRYLSREEAVAALGEEKVAEIEASFAPATPLEQGQTVAPTVPDERVVQTPDVTEGAPAPAPEGGETPPEAPEEGSAPVAPASEPEAPAGGAAAALEETPAEPAVPVSSFVGGHSMAEK